MNTSPAAAPQIIIISIISGPNGAGKSTVATRLIPPTIEYVNSVLRLGSQS